VSVDPVSARRRLDAGLLFALPATTAIVAFFFVPVGAALALSFTDFDIYAVASWHNLRFVALRNYVRLLRDPLFSIALGNTF
jgi:multiple sugar transport system permease protein